MPNAYCTYHPTRKAHWVCPKCRAGLCPSCAVAREKGGLGLSRGKIYLCPECNVQAEWVGAANLIEPFWSRLPSFFAYPFQATPLVFNLVLSFLALILGVVPFANLILGVILIKYAFMILTKTAYGDLRPPAAEAITDLNDIWPVIQQWILFLLLWVLGGFILGVGGIWGAVAYAVLVIFLLPAMIILLVTSESLLHALNPVVSIGMVSRIGRGYFLMWLFLVLLMLAPGTLIALLGKFLPAQVLSLLVNFIKNYYTFVSYFLMGYVILQYHEQLNYQIDFEDFYDPAATPEIGEEAGEDPQAEIVRQVEVFSKEGKIEEAITYIKEQTAATGIVSLILLERFYKLLKLKKDAPAMIENGEKLISQLIRENESDKACRVYIECASQKQPFQLSALDLLKIGGWLQTAGKTKAAVNAFNRMIKHHPEDALIPKAYFQLAQLYHEEMGDTDKAKKVIRSLIDKYPDHDMTAFAQRYLAGLPA